MSRGKLSVGLPARMSGSGLEPRAAALIAVAIGLLTAAVFSRVVFNGFITHYDDAVYVLENRMVRAGLTWAGVSYAFTSECAANWHPLTMLSHMLDCELFGLAAGGHHLMSLLLHALNAALLYVVLKRMTGAQWDSALVAALFAVHPLHVESVSAIAQRKDLLSTLFWLLTISAYLRYAKKPTLLAYSAVALWFVLGLMSKPMVVTLPFVLLLLDFWPLQRTTVRNSEGTAESRQVRLPISRLVVEKLPLLALTVVACVVTYGVQYRAGAVATSERLPVAQRAVNAAVSYVVYIQKTLWPVGLSAFYPHPRDTLPYWQVAAAGVVLGLITWAVVRRRAKEPYLAVGWFWYVGTLVPVIGIVQVGNQAMADRYTYVPLIGLFIAGVWGAVARLCQWQIGRAPRAVVMAVLLSVLSMLTWRQTGYWRNDETLFAHALAATENNALAHTTLGQTCLGRDDVGGAFEHFGKALEIAPTGPSGHIGMGDVLFRQNNVRAAIEHYRRAITLEPDNAVAHYHLARALGMAGEIEQAVAHCETALQFTPDSSKVHQKLAELLSRQGRYDGAAEHYAAALQLEPNDWEARAMLADVLQRMGKSEEASTQYREALELQPRNAAIHYNFGVLLERRDKLEEAAQHFEAALRLRPDLAQAAQGLDRVRAKMGSNAPPAPDSAR
ncbi:MAG: tetratricopeptide repeat protein [Candidatus Hydrogenedentes bacterium]|nr:tetratricopeptide repeat protein [Candidatus Hydrogenedentota bacterium]